MPSAALTVTAVAGPARTLTAGTFAGVKDLEVNFDKNTFTLMLSDGSFKTFDWQSVGTVTFTVSGGNGTVSIT